MKVVFCGGAGEVGASCILLRIGGKNIIFDSGIRMGMKDPLPDMRLLQENGGVDGIFISHAHMDHTGSLPVLSREYPDAKIYMTHATKDLIRVLLYDSLKIMENREAEIPIYAEVHVKNALDRILCFSPGYSFHPFENDITVTFYNAGHVAGSASIYVTCNDGSAFYSGDFSVSPQRTVEGASIPRLRPDLAIFESTYGDRLHSTREIEEEKLINKVREIITAGKKILIPAFALGRAQEVILILKKAINRGDLPAFKIYVDGMVNDICRIYRLNPNYLRHQLAKRIFRDNELFYDENITAVTGKQTEREEIISRDEGSCIISSSGMLTGGPSQWYAEKLAGDEGNFIALTGYQDEESPGRQLLEIADLPTGEDRFLKFGERTLAVKCGIGKYGLSAHADKTEIISLVHSLGARRVFFIHGNQEVTPSLAGEMQKEYRGKVYAPVNGEAFDIHLDTPRKQLEKSSRQSLGKGVMPDENSLEELWRFILGSYGVTAGFTIEELITTWAGNITPSREDFDSFTYLVNSSAYFEPEIRRPFIFHSIEEVKLLENKENQYMEVNQMLALVDNHFPPETGLYKKGARFEEKIVLLSFNFPLTAIRKLEDKFREFEAATGWKVSINTECNISAVQNLIYKLLGIEAAAVEKMSYFSVENLFKVRVAYDIKDINRVREEFRNITGIGLEIEKQGNDDLTKNTPVQAREYQVEQNQALAAIQEAFQGKKDKLYKKSLKMIDGEPCIELSLISPAVGERYKGLIDELESRLLWPIKINQTPNQNEILNVGRRLIEENGVILKKNLSYLPKEMQVAANIQPADAVILNRIKEEFERLTGLDILFS